MLRKNYEEDWEKKKRYLFRSMFEDPPALSPIQEYVEPASRGATPSPEGADLPELIVERVPKRRGGESAHYYYHLAKRMRKYYRMLFKLPPKESSSDTEFDEAAYEQYNPEYSTVTHQDELNGSYVVDRDKSTLYLGSVSFWNDSNEKERNSSSKSGERYEAWSSKDFRDKSNESVSSHEDEINVDDSQDINLIFSEDSNKIGHSGYLECPQQMIVESEHSDDKAKSETTVDGGDERKDEIAVTDVESEKSDIESLEAERNSQRKEKSGNVIDEQHTTIGVEPSDQSGDSEDKCNEQESDEVEKSVEDEMASEDCSDSEQLGENQEECNEEEGRSSKDVSRSHQMCINQDAEVQPSDQSEDSEDKSNEQESHEEEKSVDNETASESELLGENQEECNEEEGMSSKDESRSDQMSKSQGNEDDESDQGEVESDQPDEIEAMRSHNPKPSIDSLRHEQASDTDDNNVMISLTHRHSVPQDVASPDVAPEDIPAVGDDDDFRTILRTSAQWISKESVAQAGDKRSSRVDDENMLPAKKQCFRNVSLQTEDLVKQRAIGLQTEVPVRHFGIQTRERIIENENVGTQTDLPRDADKSRSIGTQVDLQKEHRNIEVQTEHTELTNVEIQTDVTRTNDVEIQVALSAAVNDIGVQTDEQVEDNRRQGWSYFFEKRGHYFFFL